MFGNTVRKDSVDFVVFLGDYIYEFQNGQYGWGDALGRIPQPNRVTYTYVGALSTTYVPVIDMCLACMTTEGELRRIVPTWTWLPTT